MLAQEMAELVVYPSRRCIHQARWEGTINQLALDVDGGQIACFAEASTAINGTHGCQAILLNIHLLLWSERHPRDMCMRMCHLTPQRTTS